jgi:hypothetical protein
MHVQSDVQLPVELGPGPNVYVLVSSAMGFAALI